LHVHPGQDAHEAGIAGEPHLALLELADELSVKALTCGEILGIDPDRLDAGGARPCQGRRVLAIGDDDGDARRKLRRRARVEQRLRMAAGARAESAGGRALACPPADRAHAASRSREGAVEPGAHTGQRRTRRMIVESRGKTWAMPQSSATCSCLRKPTSL